MKTLILIFTCLVFFSINLHAQVTRLNNNNSLEIEVPLSNNKTILVSDNDSSIWATDGTTGGTTLISNSIKYNTDESGGLLGGKLIFSGTTAATGSELFITDGTSAGTMLVKDIASGTADSDPGDMVLLNGILYFTAETAAEGRELWRTDGTAAGTTLVKDILPGAESSNDDAESYEMFSNGSYLLFAAKTASSGVELWKSDGTSAGTVLLKDINLNPNADLSSSDPNTFFKYNNLVLFLATDSAHGEEIWKTDGTTAGTVLLKDINPGSPSSTSSLINFHLFNNHVYFQANDGTSRTELWGSDGTEANTVLLKTIIPGTSQFGTLDLSDPLGAVNLPGKFIFPVFGQSISALWESDGTAAGTRLFKSSYSAPNTFSFPQLLIGLSINFTTEAFTQSLFQGNKFFFVDASQESGNELWISDGTDSTPAHTRMVKDIYPGAGDGISQGFTTYVYSTTDIYFAANDSTHGNELWESDGTLAGTLMIKDINPNEASSDPELPFYVSNGKILFTATDGDDDDNTDLFVIDGNVSPLPIKLSEFIVTTKSADALLQWSTLNEINTKDFTIQRSYDGEHFENIGDVAALGNSSSKQNYAFTDAGIGNSGKNIIYYRLIMADKDGKSVNTNIIAVRFKGNSGWSVKLLSNPVQDNANVILNGISGDLQLSVKDMSGKTLYKNLLQNINGQINIPLHSLKAGMYLLVAQTSNEIKSVKFIKQ